jgi:integrase
MEEAGLSNDTSDSHLGFLRRRVFPYFLGVPVPPYRSSPPRVSKPLKITAKVDVDARAGDEAVDIGGDAGVKVGLSGLGIDLVRDGEAQSASQGDTSKHASGHKSGHASPCRDVALADPIRWRGRSAGLCKWMISLGDSAKSVSAANGALRGFLKWLWEEGLVPGKLWEDMPLRVAPKSMRNLATPLGRALTPIEVLEFAASRRSGGDPETALLSLLGFFFSLRPQEIYALRPADFIVGSEISDSAEGLAMAAAGLYSGLGVDVWRQREDRRGEFLDPKSSSKGLVACFDEAAAEAVTSLVTEMTSGGVGKREEAGGGALADTADLIFPRKPGKIVLRWRRRGIPGVSLKDLRRASLLWLGGMTRLTPAAVMAHARHRHLMTTELYLRRPASIRENIRQSHRGNSPGERKDNKEG